MSPLGSIVMGKKTGFILLLDVEAGNSVVTRLGQVDFVDVFVTQTSLLVDGILARGEFLEVVANLLGVVRILGDSVVFTTATASATMSFADVEAFDLFEGDGVRADGGLTHKCWVGFDVLCYGQVVEHCQQEKEKKEGRGFLRPHPLVFNNDYDYQLAPALTRGKVIRTGCLRPWACRIWRP